MLERVPSQPLLEVEDVRGNFCAHLYCNNYGLPFRRLVMGLGCDCEGVFSFEDIYKAAVFHSSMHDVLLYRYCTV